VDLSDPRTLVLRQQAVIKNELGPIEDAEVFLISGFPSVQFAHVTSPLSLRTTWAKFFQQLNQPMRSASGVMSNSITQQAAPGDDPFAQGADLSTPPTDEGIDLHYQDIGKQTLAEGDSLAVDVAAGSAEYQRIVEWIVPDTRKADGTPVADYERHGDPEKYEDAAWDAIRFRNPLPFAMTTAPATMSAHGRFSGQRMSHWVNAGEETTLHVTKALSLRTRSIEQELPQKREIVERGLSRYHKSTVQGELTVNNHRAAPVALLIRRRFSGDLVAADKSPKLVLLEEGVWSVNRRNQLTWSLQVAPAEEVKLSYQYTVLVHQGAARGINTNNSNSDPFK
jgi:hypothetical protein